MKRPSLGAVLLAVLAVIVAWFVADALFSAVWFLIRLAVVLVLAAVVYVAALAVLKGRSRG